jgi:hypothetical protein
LESVDEQKLQAVWSLYLNADRFSHVILLLLVLYIDDSFSLMLDQTEGLNSHHYSVM